MTIKTANDWVTEYRNRCKEMSPRAGSPLKILHDLLKEVMSASLEEGFEIADAFSIARLEGGYGDPDCSVDMSKAREQLKKRLDEIKNDKKQ